MPVEVVDNSEEVLEAIKRAKNAALEAIGVTAVNYAKEDCPVDTGRLRASIDHAVEGEDAYIGTNVEYAPYVEFGDTKNFTVGKAHFLRDAATLHSEEYKEIVDNIMRNA